MSAERDFLIWLSTRQFMVVKKHRPEIRAHLVKALLAGARNSPTPNDLPKQAERAA